MLDTKLMMEVDLREVGTIKTLRKYGWSASNLDDIFIKLSSPNEGWRVSVMRCSRCRAIVLEINPTHPGAPTVYCPACEEWV